MNEQFPPILPEQASTFAEKVDPLFWALTIFLFVFSLAVTLVFIYLGLKYRQRFDGRKSIHTDNIALETTWAIAPTILALGIFAWGAVVFYDFAEQPDNALDINVIGKRWMWKLQHPNGVREVNELHVPVNKPVKLTMTSQDVIHSFYIPAFRVKQDVLPGRYSTMWFEATKTGTFPLFCAEYCGTEHSTMGGYVTVMKPEAYQEWLGGGPAITPAKAGEQLFQQMGCATCHAEADTSRGPNLEGVFGSEVQLKGGETAMADEEYIRESIVNPTVKVVDGYAPIMPVTFGNQLSEDELNNLVAYIKSIGEAE